MMVGCRHRRYPRYQSSSVAWLPTLPHGWEVRRFKFGAQLVNAKVADAQQDFYVALENIESLTGRYLSIEGASEPESVVGRFRKDDVLFGKLRPYLVKAWKAERSGVCSTEFFVLRGKQYMPDFLRWLCLSPGFVGQVDGSTFGSKMPRASWSDVGELPTPLPPLYEQRAISAFLDRETARIDSLIDKKRQLTESLQEKRVAIIAHAVTRGLDASKPLKDSGVPWIGWMPRHWEVCRVKMVARLESGHTPSRAVPENWEDCDIPWVSLNDSKQLARSDYISETAVQINKRGLENSSARILPADAVVFTRDATIGLAAITTRPMAVSQHLIAWIPGPRINSRFLLRVFNAMKPFLDAHTFGATIKTIGMPDVKKLVTPVPPMSEQLAIADALERAVRYIDQAVEKNQSSLDRLIEYRSALIAAAVTGQIDVREAA